MYLYDHVVVSHVGVCVGMDARGVRACLIFVHLFSCLCAEPTLSDASSAEKKKSVLHKKRKVGIFIFSQKGLPFSLVNSRNEIYRYEYIL